MQKSNTKKYHTIGIAFLSLAVFILVPGACGMKGPPKPPKLKEPPVVNDLSHQIENDSVKLSWTIPKEDGQRPRNLAGFKIFRFKQTLKEAECKECPPEYMEIWDLPIVDTKTGKAAQDRMTFSETLESGYRYVYKVKVYLDNGVVGADSNLVDFRFEKKGF